MSNIRSGVDDITDRDRVVHRLSGQVFAAVAGAVRGQYLVAPTPEQIGSVVTATVSFRKGMSGNLVLVTAGHSIHKAWEAARRSMYQEPIVPGKRVVPVSPKQLKLL